MAPERGQLLTRENHEPEQESIPSRVRHALIGARRNIADPSLFHKIALIPILAWIGLGADGLSSSSYGPPEAFMALRDHIYLAIFLALATAITVFVISYAYSRIIEHFPSGGGGYIVAGWLLWNECDFFLLRTDSLGDSVWARIYGGPYTDLCYDAVETPDGASPLPEAMSTRTAGMTSTLSGRTPRGVCCGRKPTEVRAMIRVSLFNALQMADI
jgi:hypothetical protein